jgi:hypothetical protein
VSLIRIPGHFPDISQFWTDISQFWTDISQFWTDISQFCAREPDMPTELTFLSCQLTFLVPAWAGPIPLPIRHICSMCAREPDASLGLLFNRHLTELTFLSFQLTFLSFQLTFLSFVPVSLMPPRGLGWGSCLARLTFLSTGFQYISGTSRGWGSF